MPYGPRMMADVVGRCFDVILLEDTVGWTSVFSANLLLCIIVCLISQQRLEIRVKIIWRNKVE